MPAADAGNGLCRSPHLLGSNHVRLEHGQRSPWRRQQLRRRCFAWPPVTSMTGAPCAKQFLPLPPFLAVVGGSAAVSSPSLKPVTTRIHPIVSSPPTEPQRVVRPPGIGKNVLPVTESAATECAFGCGSLGGLLTGPKLLMPVSATLVPASMMPSD